LRAEGVEGVIILGVALSEKGSTITVRNYRAMSSGAVVGWMLMYF